MTPSLKHSFFIVFLIVSTELIGFGLIIPVLPQLASQFEIDYFFIGLLMASYSIAQFISAPILGHLSDKFGRKPILILSKLGSVISYVILAFSSQYWMFLVSRLLDGFTGGNISVARAYLVDITDKKNRAKGMAIIGISFGIGFILGPALGGVFHGGSHGQLITSFIAGGLSLIALILTILFLQEPDKHVETVSQTSKFKLGFAELKSLPVFILCLSYFGYMLVFSGFETSFVMFTDYIFSFSITDNSWLFMYAGLVGLFTQGFISRKSSVKFSLFVTIGLLVFSFSFLGLAFSRSIFNLLLFLAMLSCGFSITNTYMPSLLSSVVSSKKQGVVMGFYEGIGSLSRIIGPILTYMIAQQFIHLEYMGFSIVLFIITVTIFLSYKFGFYK